MSLEVRHLAVTIGPPGRDLALIEDVSLRLQRGGTLGVVGESGSGKSMLALAIMGLLPDGATAVGSIGLDGRELIGLGEEALCAIRGAAIGMVFQEPLTALNPAMTIGDQVAEPLVLHRGLGWSAARKTAEELLARVGIASAGERLDAYPHQLSGGQRQRVGIAIALACGPEILLADEPTTALDVTVQAQILDLLRGLVAETGMGLLLISHDLAVVAEIAERTLVMYAGRGIETGPTEAVLRAPAHPYTRLLLAASPGHGVGPGGRFATIPGTVPGPGSRPPGCRFSDRCPFMIPACQEAVPPMIPVGADHAAACIRVGEIG